MPQDDKSAAPCPSWHEAKLDPAQRKRLIRLRSGPRGGGVEKSAGLCRFLHAPPMAVWCSSSGAHSASASSSAPADRARHPCGRRACGSPSTSGTCMQCTPRGRIT